MRECVRELCMISLFCGAVLSVCPEGGVKKLLRVLESVILLAVLIRHVSVLNLAPYRLENARMHERQQEIIQGAENRLDRLDRLVIEEEYRSYIEKRAEAAGLHPAKIQIRVRWNKEGLWVPESSSIWVVNSQNIRALSEILSGDLGIPPEQQEWIVDE